jgi:hypothetical protein
MMHVGMTAAAHFRGICLKRESIFIDLVELVQRLTGVAARRTVTILALNACKLWCGYLVFKSVR